MATETELENLVVRLTGEGSQYQQMLEKAEKSTDSAAQKIEAQTKRIEGFGNSIKGFASTALSYLGALGVATSLGGAFSKFEQFEKVTNRLKTTIEANGRAVDESIASYNKFAAEIAKTTTVSKAATIGMLQQVEAMGITGSTAEKVVKNSIALAAAKGGEAQEYIRVAIAMEQGNTHMLRHVLGLHQITDESQLMAKAQEMISRGMKIAEGDTKLLSFQVEKAKQSFAALNKDIGAIVAGYLAPLVQKLKEGAEWFSSLDSTTKKYLVTTVAILAAVGPLLGVYGMMTSKVVGLVKWFGDLAISIKNQGGALAAAGAGWQLWAAGAVMIGYLTYRIIAELTGEEAAIRRRNAAIKEGQELRQREISHYQDLSQKVIAESETKGDYGKQREFLQKELAEAEAAREAIAEDLARAKTSGGYSTQEYAQMRGKLEGVNRLIDEFHKKLDSLSDTAVFKKLRDDAANFVADVDKQMATLGMSEGQKKLFDLRNELNVKKPVQDYYQALGELQTQLDQGKISLEEYESQVKALNDRYGDVPATLAKVEEAEKKLQEFEAAQEAKKLADDIDNLTQQLEEQAATFGMTSQEASLFKLQLRGATEEQLAAAKAAGEELEAMEEWQKAMQKGKEVTKEMETPFEKLTNRLEELDDLFLKGAIDLETYNRATDKAADDYESATKEANKLKEAMKFDAALAGSAEALARISAFQDLIKPASDQVGEVKRAVQAGRLTPEDKEAMSSVAEEINDQTPILIDIRSILGAIKDGINSAGGPRNPDLDTNQPADINGNLGVGD